MDFVWVLSSIGEGSQALGVAICKTA